MSRTTNAIENIKAMLDSISGLNYHDNVEAIERMVKYEVEKIKSKHMSKRIVLDKHECREYDENKLLVKDNKVIFYDENEDDIRVGILMNDDDYELEFNEDLDMAQWCNQKDEW